MSYIDQIKPAAESAVKSDPITDQLEAASMRLTEAAALTYTIDQTFFADILERANSSGDASFVADADRLICLLPILKRELEGVRDAVGDVISRIFQAQPSTNLPAWTAAMDYYRAAEAADLSGLSEKDQDAVFDAAGDALDAVIHTRSPNLVVMLEKMRLVQQTGTILAEGYFDQLLLDAEALADATASAEA